MINIIEKIPGNKKLVLSASAVAWLLVASLATLDYSVEAQRITIDGTRFVVDRNEIFINGVNTPWDNWNDFGGNYDHNFWNTEFQEIRQAGGNASRIWISCNGDVGIDILESGEVNGATAAHWEDLDDMFSLAAQHKVYIMATLTSFDHTKNTYNKYLRWRNMLADNGHVDSYIKNYVIPFINRYKDNPYLWCVDICNEPEWVHENSECGKIAWERLQYFAARVAAAVHENSSVLVTLGSAAVKWNSDSPGCVGNFWSDQDLQARYDSPEAFLDFYSPHFYGWTVRWFGNFALDKTPADYDMNDRPCMVGENPAKGVFIQNEQGKNILVVPIAEAYIKTYLQGWKGLMVWTSNGVDGNGSLADCAVGLTAFNNQYPGLVNPAAAATENPVKSDKPLQICPNPAAGYFTLGPAAGKTIAVEILDVAGTKKQDCLINPFDQPEIDIRSLLPGLYVVQLLSDEEINRIRLLVQ